MCEAGKPTEASPPDSRSREWQGIPPPRCYRQTIYARKCVNCHGTSGKGDGAGAAPVEKAFKKKVGDVTATDLSKLATPERTAKIAELKKLLAEAKPPMSAFWKTLTSADQATVFDYVLKTFMKSDT